MRRVVWYTYFREAPEGAEVEAEPESSQLGVITAVSLAAAGVLVVGLSPSRCSAPPKEQSG